ncbi:hypothetical protein Cni_G26802 [Canna indica]|uniref:Uncharacterized protein n=1 Tax=Canna indica TaxID=4628 RepID=A0AAQ3L0I1_9LILI|nr:hypothetical protein Cni_G26802 [Canna indica]
MDQKKNKIILIIIQVAASTCILCLLMLGFDVVDSRVRPGGRHRPPGEEGEQQRRVFLGELLLSRCHHRRCNELLLTLCRRRRVERRSVVDAAAALWRCRRSELSVDVARQSDVFSGEESVYRPGGGRLRSDEEEEEEECEEGERSERGCRH